MKKELPELAASLLDWYFNPDKPSWTAKFLNEDEERQWAFITQDLMTLCAKYLRDRNEIINKEENESAIKWTENL